ncbi:MAG: hypothetical protein KIT82_00690 [Bradyrhizobium sp.]|nr:hypothetical protein [Bradyrhizobium sp.]
MRTNIDSVVAEILSIVLDRPVAPGEFVSRAEEDRWDSLRHIEIVFALESALNIELDETEIGEVASSSDLCSVAEVRLAS